MRCLGGVRQRKRVDDRRRLIGTGLTGFLEGPAYSGSIALRQRHSPPEARAQVLTTVSGFSGLALSAGAAVGGAIDDPLALIGVFIAVNLVAAVAAIARGALSPS